MAVLSDYHREAPPPSPDPTTGWCCAPFSFRRRGSSSQKQLDEKAGSDISDRPDSQTRSDLRPSVTADAVSDLHQTTRRRSSKTARMSFSSRKRVRSDASSMKHLISAPSEFRHLSSGSFPAAIPEQSWMAPRRPSTSSSARFQPLQLSIDSLEDRMSPILPVFEFPRHEPSPPPAYVSDEPHRGHQLLRQRSYSSLSFHIPRKRTAESLSSTGQHRLTPPNTPPPPPPRSRARAQTAPEINTMRERVASAMIEVEILQKEIDQVIERQSLYENSRPSTPLSSRAAHELEPMPSIPALPPPAPSFAQRLNVERDRPPTPPMDPAQQSRQSNTRDSSSTDTRKSKQHVAPIVLAPPLPLVLRPPLRKKKSFSRMSTWLFPDPDNRYGLRMHSVTNTPRPLTDRDGFYQCVADGDKGDNCSYGSFDSLSTWKSEEDPSTNTATAQEMAPMIPQDEPARERCGTFGSHTTGLGMTTVGMAL